VVKSSTDCVRDWTVRSVRWSNASVPYSGRPPSFQAQACREQQDMGRPRSATRRTLHRTNGGSGGRPLFHATATATATAAPHNDVSNNNIGPWLPRQWPILRSNAAAVTAASALGRRSPAVNPYLMDLVISTTRWCDLPNVQGDQDQEAESLLLLVVRYIGLLPQSTMLE
jgi:hypothetical protein